MATIHWASDLAAESRVKRLGGTMTVQKGIPLKEIDIHGSRANNARLESAFREDLALEYAISMEAGDRFPYPILRAVQTTRHNGTGGHSKFKYSVLSGNHRVGAAELNKAETVDAYILDSTDEQVIELVCRSANRWMGDRQNREEAIEHARAMMDKYAFSAAHMAKVFGLREQNLQAALRAESIRDLLEKNLVNATGIPRNTLLALSPMSDNHEVLRQAGLAVLRHKMTQDTAKKMCADVQAARDERSMLQAITKWEQTMEEEKPKAAPGTRVRAQKTDPRAKLTKLLNNVLDFLDRGGPGRKAFMSLSQLRITTPEDKKALLAKYREVRAAVKRCVDGEGSLYRANGHTNTAKHKRRKAVRRG